MGQMGQNLDATQRQQLLDQLAVGQYQDQRNQQQLDFDYEQYQNEQAFPATYLDNLNRGGQLGLGIANATASGAGAGGQGGGQRNPLAAMIGGGLSGFLATGNPWGAAAGAGLGLLGVNDQNSFAGLGKLMGDKPEETTTNPGANYQGGPAGNSGGRGGGRVAAPNAVNDLPSLSNNVSFQAGGGGGRKIGRPQTGGPLLRFPAQQKVISKNASPLAGKASGLGGGFGGIAGGGGFGGIAGAVNKAIAPVANMAGGGGVAKMSGNLFGQIQNAATTLGGQVAQPNQQQPPRATGLKFGPLGGFGGFGGFGMV